MGMTILHAGNVGIVERSQLSVAHGVDRAASDGMIHDSHGSWLFKTSGLESPLESITNDTTPGGHRQRESWGSHPWPSPHQHLTQTPPPPTC